MIELEIFAFINHIRQHPASIIPVLTNRLTQQFLFSSYHQKMYSKLGKPITYTYEGAQPVRQLISKLQQTPSLPLLKYHNTLQKIAKQILENQNPNSLKQIFKKYIQYDGVIGQNYEQDEDLIQLVLQMLVNDGNQTRNGRQNILFIRYKYAGVSVQKKQNLNRVCVVFAQHLQQNQEKQINLNKNDIQNNTKNLYFNFQVKEKKVQQQEVVRHLKLVQQQQKKEKIKQGQSECENCTIF